MPDYLPDLERFSNAESFLVARVLVYPRVSRRVLNLCLFIIVTTLEKTRRTLVRENNEDNFRQFSEGVKRA